MGRIRGFDSRLKREPKLISNSYDRYATDTDFSRPTMLYISGGSNIVLDNFRMKNAPSVFVNLRDATKVATFSNLKLDATSKSTHDG